MSQNDISVSTLADQICSTALEEEHFELATMLKEYSLSSLYKKFCDAGVTKCMLFELDVSTLDNDVHLSNLEKSAYLKAKRIYHDNKNKQSGTN